MIIPIVLHRVVQNKPLSFEDVNIQTLKHILSMNCKRYITTRDYSLKNQGKNKYYYMLTFDDGFVSDYEIVFPLLLKLNIKATFFINPDNVGKPGYVTWEMLKEMRDSEMMIGSHGHSHINMTLVDESEAKFNLVESKKCLKSIFFDDTDVFSFPYGGYNSNLIGLAKSVGYKYCFSSRHGVIDRYTDIFPRNSINGSMSFADIDRILNLRLYTRFIWKLEDVIKSLIKLFFGDRVYVTIRKYIVSNRKNA